MPRSRKAAGPVRDLARENFELGLNLVRSQPILSGLYMHSGVHRQEGNRCPKDGWAVVTLNGAIHVHPTRRGAPEEWLYVLGHCLLHLGFGHFQPHAR